MAISIKSVMENKKLQKLYKQIDKCKFCKAARNKLRHIYGFGAMNPKLMLILVNPTYRNLSCGPKYKGARFPNIGVRQFWRVLADGGLISKKIAAALPPRAGWKNGHTKSIQGELTKNKLFLTNAVKCCYSHSEYPTKNVIESQLKFLSKEIRIVNPKKIVAFGALVYKTLTGKSLKLADYWKKKRRLETEKISGLNISVTPCYFPIGRGNPKKAAEILRSIARFC